MRFPCFEQSNYGNRQRRVISLFLALCLLFSFFGMPFADAADDAGAPVFAPATASAETTPAAPTASAEATPPAESTLPETPAPAETAPPETTVPATAAPDEPVTEPTEPAAPPATTEPTGTTAPAGTTETASSRETTEPPETTASAGTTNPADTTAPAGTTATTVTAAPAAPDADDKALGLFASDTTAQTAATVTCYAAVDGAWKQVAVLQTDRQYLWAANANRYFLYHTELAAVYGAFGYDADSYDGTRIFPHTDNNAATKIWADADAILNAETGEYRIPLSTRTTIFLYYMPANVPGNPAYFNNWVETTNQTCIDANNFYALEPYDPGGIFGTALPAARYIFHGETGSITLPYTEDTVWLPENPTTGEAIDLAGVIDKTAGTITFTLENAAYSVRLRAKSDIVRVIYHAGLTDSLTKLGQFAVSSQTIVLDGSVRGLVDYAEKLIKNADDTYTVRGIDNDRAKVTVRSDSSARSLYYTFAGWRAGSATSDLIFQPGDVLTQADIDQCLAASSGGNAEFYAVWKAYDQNNRLTTLNFYVNINCEIADNMSDGFQQNPLYDYTASVYSTRLFGTDAITETGDVMLIAPPTSSDSAYEVDAAFRAATTVPIEGTLIEAIPSEEAVLAAIRASDKVIKLDGVVVPHEQITSEHFKLRWYVLKYEHSDGWHVDGVLVAKAARLTVTKTFAGDAEAIAEAKQKFYITVEHADEDGTTVRDYTLRLDDADSVTADGEAGYKSYDAATDTYIWSVPVRKGRAYTVAEHGYLLDDDVRWHHSNRVEVTNCPEAILWQDGTAATVTADSYPNDVPDMAIQTVAFRNLYVQAGLLTVFKTDLGTGHGLRNVTFRLSRTDGTAMQLWQMPGTNRYSSDSSAATEGYTTLVPGNAVTTDQNGYFYVKLAVGEYFLDETVPLGYEGASRMRVSVTDDGKVEIAVAVTAGADPPEGGWLEGVGTPILTVKNRSKLLTQVKAEKSWDNTDEADRLPVTVELWRNGAKMVGDIYTQTLSEENDWNYIWYDLPLFVDGDYGRYTLREISIGDTAHDPSAGTSGYENYLVSYDAALYREGETGAYQNTAVWQDADSRWHFADHLLLGVHNSERRGIISFTKVDENGRTLPGAGFTLYADAACTKELEQVYADESGFVEFEPVSAGTYYLRETETPYGYKESTTLYRAVLRGGVVTITDADDAAATPLTQIVNVSIARLTLQKENFAGEPLTGAVFRLSGDTVTAVTYTVGDDGKLTIPELPNGNYLLEEVIAPSGYKKLTEPIPFRVDSGEIELESAAESRFYAFAHVSGYTYKLTVHNEPLFTIPTVGGTGIYPLTLAGTVLMCVAAAVLLCLRRFGRRTDDDAADADKDEADKEDTP